MEFSFLDPVDLDSISASGFQFRFMDVHHCDIPARPCQSTTKHDSDASRADDVDTLHPYEYLAAPKPQAVLKKCHRIKSGILANDRLKTVIALVRGNVRQSANPF